MPGKEAGNSTCRGLVVGKWTTNSWDCRQFLHNSGVRSLKWVVSV